MTFNVNVLVAPRIRRSAEARARQLAGLRIRDSVVVGTTASVLSIASWSYFHHLGVVLAYQDAISHLQIARRVLDSTTPGFAQLGGVWLPLPHLLMLPFVWDDTLYYSGFAGSFVSMAAYVATSVLLYKIASELTGRRVSGLVAATVFMANPGVIYMQSTPMTELLMFALIAGLVYGLQRWIVTNDYRVLLVTGIVALLGTLTRYEVWVILAVMVPLIAFISWRRGSERAEIEGTALAFVSVAGLGIAGWLGWNQLIFGNALNWEDGKYAKPSLWVGSADAAVGHWLVSIETYWYAMVDNIGATTIVVGALGVVFALTQKGTRLQALPALSQLVMFPFFVLSLKSGQRPLHVLQIGNDLYNVRFGLVMILPIAIFAGYLPTIAHSRAVMAVLSCAVLGLVATHSVTSFLHPSRRIAALEEPLRWQQSSSASEQRAATFLKRHYEGGRILAQFFGNEDLLFSAHIRLDNNVYEGSDRQWLPALASPAEHRIEWIVMRYGDGSDQVTAALAGSAALRPYRLVYRNSAYWIYERA